MILTLESGCRFLPIALTSSLSRSIRFPQRKGILHCCVSERVCPPQSICLWKSGTLLKPPSLQKQPWLLLAALRCAEKGKRIHLGAAACEVGRAHRVELPLQRRQFTCGGTKRLCTHPMRIVSFSGATNSKSRLTKKTVWSNVTKATGVVSAFGNYS